MSERMRESLSALMDDEADDLELARVLRAMDEDDDVSGTWSRFHLASAVLRGTDPGQLAGSAGFSVELLDDEEVIDDDGVPAAGERADEPRGMRTWVSFATAAALTLAVVLGVQIGGEQAPEVAVADVGGSAALASGEIRTDLRGVRRASDGAAIAGRPTGALVLPGRAADRVLRAAPAVGEDARRQVDAYMLDHAEFTLVNAPAGLVPFARYATFERGR